MSNIEIIQGDCLEKLPGIGSNTVDTVITDPPYNLGFMGKQWDTIRNFQEWVESWARECLRILKPGGTLLCFGGTTGCACVKTGRDFIGIEKELEFVEIAENRIHYWEDQQQQEKEKMGLFTQKASQP